MEYLAELQCVGLALSLRITSISVHMQAPPCTSLVTLVDATTHSSCSRLILCRIGKLCTFAAKCTPDNLAGSDAVSQAFVLAAHTQRILLIPITWHSEIDAGQGCTADTAQVSWRTMS